MDDGKYFLPFSCQCDARMESSNINMMLFVDKFPAHPPDTTFFKNIKEAFLPVNCMSRMKPLDLYAIQCLKEKYSKPLVQKAIVATQRKSELKLNVMHIIHMIVPSWTAVWQQLIIDLEKQGSLPHTYSQNKTKMRMMSENKTGENCPL
jgi:hypothetical protein